MNAGHSSLCEFAPRVGQVWDDHGTRATVVSVADDGAAVVKLDSGERLPVIASFFSRARLVEESQRGN